MSLRHYSHVATPTLHLFYPAADREGSDLRTKHGVVSQNSPHLFGCACLGPAPYMIEEDETIFVKNKGGRLHTFTEVENFGGGRVAGLNFDLLRVPECPLQPPDDPNNLPPGARLKIKHLSPGTHLFMCCIHPWMRAVIKVQPAEDKDQ